MEDTNGPNYILLTVLLTPVPAELIMRLAVKQLLAYVLMGAFMLLAAVMVLGN